MMTVLLWILLTLAAAALVIIASPIRFGAAGTFGTSRRAEGKFWVSYVHPALFAYEYSSMGRKERAVIFGLNPKRFKWKKRKRPDDINTDNGIDNSDSNSNIKNGNIILDSPDSNGDINKNNIPLDNPDNAGDINIDNNIDNNDGGGDTFMARMARRAENIKRGSIYTKTVDRLKGVRGDFYRHFKNRACRKKLFRWLKRALRYAVTTVRFDRLELRAAAGFEDPAQTGRAYGYFIAAKSALQPRGKALRLEMVPVFTEKTLEAEIEFSCRTSIAAIASNALTLALTFPYKFLKRGKKQ